MSPVILDTWWLQTRTTKTSDNNYIIVSLDYHSFHRLISRNTAKATRSNIVASSLHFKRLALVFHMSVLLSGLVNLHLTSRWSVSVRVLSGPFPSPLVTSVRNSDIVTDGHDKLKLKPAKGDIRQQSEVRSRELENRAERARAAQTANAVSTATKNNDARRTHLQGEREMAHDELSAPH